MLDRHDTEHKSFATPDETRKFNNGRAEVIEIGGGEIGRLIFEPGWRWSNDVKPIVKTELCMVHHTGYCISGRLHISPSDGSEFEIGPGDVNDIEPGHDAWVVGDEPYVGVDFAEEISEYGKPAS